MKPSKVAMILLFVGWITGAALPAMAGTEPSPFRFALGAERLIAVDSFEQVLVQMVDEVLQVPFDELTPGETRGLTQATFRMSGQLRMLNRQVALVGRDLLDTRLNDPSYEERQEVLIPLAAITDNAATIVALVEPYLGTRLREAPPGFLLALTAVLQQAENLRQNAISLAEAVAPRPPR